MNPNVRPTTRRLVLAASAGAVLGALAWMFVRSWLGVGAFVVAVSPVSMLALPLGLAARRRGRGQPIDVFPRVVAGHVGYLGGIGLALSAFGIFTGSDLELVFGVPVVCAGLLMFRFMQVRAQRLRY